MAVSINEHGEVFMKLSDFPQVSNWIQSHPEHTELSFNEGMRKYVDEQEEARA